MSDEREIIVAPLPGLFDQVFREVFAKELARIKAYERLLTEEACAREGHGWATLPEGRWCVHCHATDPPGVREARARLSEAEIRANERRRICREEGCKLVESTRMGEVDRELQCVRCGETRTKPPEVPK